MVLSRFRQRALSAWPWVVLWVASVALGLIGCTKQPKVQASTSDLEKAFATAGAANTANAYVQAALAAARTNDFLSAIALLQQVAKTGRASPDQLMAVEQAKLALFSELQSRAAKGDANAKATLATLEKRQGR